MNIIDMVNVLYLALILAKAIARDLLQAQSPSLPEEEPGT